MVFRHLGCGGRRQFDYGRLLSRSTVHLRGPCRGRPAKLRLFDAREVNRIVTDSIADMPSSVPVVGTGACIWSET